MSSTPSRPFHIAIVGGGIGGLCTAIGLLKQGISFTVYESAHAFAEIGAGVSFGPNSMRSMSLISPEIQAGFERRATKNAWPEKDTTWFDFRLGMKNPTAHWADGTLGKEGEFITSVKALNVGQHSVHRAHFLDELVALIPSSNAKFGKRLEKLTQKPDGKMELEFHDGSKAEADAVIGCDGVKSVSRKILLGSDHTELYPTFSGKYAYRGLVPMEKAVAALGDEQARNAQMHLGKHGHILTMAIEKGATMNVVAFRTQPEGKWENEKWVIPMRKEDLFRDFEGWGDSATKILQMMEKPDVWALFDHPPAPSFYQGHLCLLGDAAHATTPHQGAGAGQAVEDAYILTELLGQCSSTADLEKAFGAYDAVRRPRSQKVVTTSRKVGEIYEFENAELGEDLDALKRTLGSWYQWIWEEDMEGQLAKAVKIMKGEKNGL